MDYTFWLGKEAPRVEYDFIPCPPDYIMVEVPTAKEAPDRE